MPRKRRRLKEKKLQLQALYAKLRQLIRSGEPWEKDTRYNNSHLADLIYGNFYFEDSWPDEQGRREAWEELKADILEQHITHMLGSRPAAWWQYELVDGAKPARRLVRGAMPAVVGDLFFGVPGGFSGVDPDNYPEWESQREFLERNGLLFREEIPLIEKGAEADDDELVY